MFFSLEVEEEGEEKEEEPSPKKNYYTSRMGVSSKFGCELFGVDDFMHQFVLVRVATSLCCR